MNKKPIVLFAICIAAFIATAGAAANAEYAVTTVAGSGLSGVRDGDASSAQFMKPVGIAADQDGNLYVADAAAQRIRVISAAGEVQTLAGSGAPQFNGMWVVGGFKDGPAVQARFNRPSGVAVAPDGSVYVADTLNHCVRVIKNGIVSTYSGSPDDTAGNDGSIANASFIRPRALAFDANGDLFVADEPIGVRKISGGTVTTLPLLPEGADKRFYSIAFSGSANKETMYVGTANEIIAFDRQWNVISRQPVSGGDTLFGPRGVLNATTVDQSQATGPAFGIVAFSDGRIVFADTRSHALRMLTDFAEPVTQSLPTLMPDAADFGGGYRDGSFQDALFDAPMGLVALPDGSIAVADSGNRRIRKLAPSAHTEQSPKPSAPVLATNDVPGAGDIVAGEDPFPGISDRYYRIAYIGNSYAFYNTRWSDSIPGLIEAKLRARWRALGIPKEPKLISISPVKSLNGFQEYINNILSLGVVDAVILQLNATNIGESFPIPYSATYDSKKYAQTWTTPTRRVLVDMNSVLKKAGIPLVVVVNPTAAHLSPLEVPVVNEVTGYQDWMFLAYGPPSGDTFEADMRDVIARSGVPSINLFDDFLAAEQDAHRVPLFGTVNSHYSEYGRVLAATVIAKKLIQMHVWANARQSRSSGQR